ERYGVLEYWIADKDRRTLDVYQRQNDKFIKLGTFSDGDTFLSSAMGKPVELAGVFEGLA
ncbi:MAG: Uma2 family endonuclease, partial [Phototrophicales bacterium]